MAASDRLISLTSPCETLLVVRRMLGDGGWSGILETRRLCLASVPVSHLSSRLCLQYSWTGASLSGFSEKYSQRFQEELSVEISLMSADLYARWCVTSAPLSHKAKQSDSSQYGDNSKEILTTTLNSDLLTAAGLQRCHMFY